MTDAARVPAQTVPLLKIVDTPVAPSCDGDFCAVPEHHTQAAVNRRVDSDDI
ncbi:hypothetical protein ACFFGH_10185 [Lysobacter korlensis]|uniref:Uncharacterized protein n=1 Tax=Lysobacter korlensis TaxID=553636 RepID=A0ABV6RMM4_9GAMM